MDRPLHARLAVPLQWMVAVLCAAAAAVLITDSLTATGGTPLWDTHAYWQAAVRLREGLPLYHPSLDPSGNVAFRYAPWFAAAWVPLTYLPPELVLAAWWSVVAVAWVLCIVPLRASPLAVLLVGSMTFHGVWVGNVQSLMMLPLVYRLHSRDGPAWIAIAASLKAVPLLFVLVYVGRREWRQAAMCLVLTAALTTPMLLFDLSGYPVASAPEDSLLGVSPIIWAATAIAGVVTALSLSTTPIGGVAAGAAALLALPRLVLYDVSFLLAGSGKRK